MKPTNTPSLIGSENHQITPWQIIQRGSQPNSTKAGSRRRVQSDSRLRTSRKRQIHDAKDHQQPSILSCWGLTEEDLIIKEHRSDKKTFWGDQKTNLQANIFRCATHNINNLPENKWMPKSREVALMATGKDTADVRLWQEIGLFWPKIQEDDQWNRRTKNRSHGMTSIFGYNSLEPAISAPYQPGGTAAIANSRLSARLKGKGSDPRGLGRWTWIRCGDDDRIHTTFFSVYRPCTPSASAGTTTYDQHCRHIEPSKEPRELLLVELEDEVRKFQVKGDNIIIGMDANENIQGRRIKLFMSNLNLKNSLTDLHGLVLPSTTITNDSNIPIDILMCTKSLNPVAAGIDSEGGSTSDHAWVWADFKQEELFGTEYKEFHKFVYKLNSDDPRLTNKYNHLTLKRIRDGKLDKDLDKLCNIQEGRFETDHIIRYNELLVKTTKIRKDVASKLRHVYTGQREWSPDWRNAQDTKHLWWLILKRIRIANREIKGRVGLRKIRRLMKKFGFRDALQLPRSIVELRLKKAKDHYNQTCKCSKDLRDMFKMDLDVAMANRNQTSVQVERKKRKTIESQREAGRAISRLKRKDRPRVNKVYVTTEDGRIGHTKKQHIEEACINENRRRFSQSINTPPMEEEVIDRIGYCAEQETAEHILSGTEDLAWVKDKYLKLVLDNLRKPEIVKKEGDIPNNINLKEHIRGWKKQKVRTSSER